MGSVRSFSIAIAAALLASSVASARDIYVSITRGQNNADGTKDAPKKLLWRVLSELQAGDRVHVAAGTYDGQGKSGTMPKIEVSDVVIQGGWNDTFTERNPFQHLTIISAPGDTQSAGKTVIHAERSDNNLTDVTIDGFCIDRGTGNYYYGAGEIGPNNAIEGHTDNSAWGYQAINVKKSGSDPTVVLVGKGRFTVKNMMIVNSPWWGIYVKCGTDGETLIENNLVLIAGSRGIEAICGGGWGKPTIRLRNNTVAFVHTFGSDGRGISLDPKADNGKAIVENNVIAYCDEGGVTTKFAPSGDQLELRNNTFFFCKKADFNVAGNGLCNAGEFEDELTIKTAVGNTHALPQFTARVAKDWLHRYTLRKVDYLAGGKITDAEVMAARQAVGLAEYHIHGFDKTFPSYSALPDSPPNYSHSRYPRPMKVGELINFAEAVAPIAGADGDRGVQATPR
jgi:hypothetical protein